MEPLDTAHEALRALAREIENYASTVTTEQDTRLKVVDRILTEILGWSLADIQTEERAGTGYVDYRLSLGGRSRLIVEVKRDGRDFDLDDVTPGRAYKLRGPGLRGVNVQEGVEQAIRYCGQKNAELACITNGKQWVVFRGSRLGDGLDTLDGMAFVFPTLEAVLTEFQLFHSLLSVDAVEAYRFRAYFQEAEGRPIRISDFRRSLRAPESRRLLGYGALAGDLDRVMTSFFRRISGDDDPDLLIECFVVTRESRAADERLARISEDLLGQIRTLSTPDARELQRLIERVRLTKRNEFVLIVGTKGAGKTTFIDRFFRIILPAAIADNCVVIKANLADHPGDEADVVNWLDRTLLEELERTLFGGRAPTFEELQGMFYDDYSRWRSGTMKYLYDHSKEKFKIEFGRHIEHKRTTNPNDYVRRLLQHVVRVRRKLPCLVFDNADHFTIEFQERVFQYARSIYEGELALIIMPITDRTSWHLSKEGALRSFESESLFLPTPTPKRVLERRIAFLERRLSEERREPGRGYFLGRGIHLSLENLTAFTAALQSVFLRTGSASRWIGTLSNGDIRQCLDFAKIIATSPHIGVDELLKAYVGQSTLSIPTYKVKKAAIRTRYDIYPQGDHRFVQNIYWLDEERETSPLAGLRLLALLRDARRSFGQDHFLTIEQVVEYARAMSLDPSVTIAWLERLLETGLCWSYDPTITSIKAAEKLELSLSGMQHLRWGLRDKDYIQAMLEVTPILDREVFEELDSLSNQPKREVWKQELDLFGRYLLDEDRRYIQVPNHPAYRGQDKIVGELRKALAAA